MAQLGWGEKIPHSGLILEGYFRIPTNKHTVEPTPWTI